MKKDIFNGKIQIRFVGLVMWSLIFLPAICIGCSLLFFLSALLNGDIEQSLRIMLFVMSGIGTLTSVLYPTLSIFAIKTYPKHKKLAHLLIKDYVFINADIKDETKNDIE